MNNFPTRLKELRKTHASNYTVADFAELFNLKRRTVFGYEQGSSTPAFAILLNLADYFCVSIDYLVGRSDEPEYEKYVPLAEAAFLTAVPDDIAKQYQAETHDLPLEAKPAIIRKYESMFLK